MFHEKFKNSELLSNLLGKMKSVGKRVTFIYIKNVIKTVLCIKIYDNNSLQRVAYFIIFQLYKIFIKKK